MGIPPPAMGVPKNMYQHALAGCISVLEITSQASERGHLSRMHKSSGGSCGNLAAHEKHVLGGIDWSDLEQRTRSGKIGGKIKGKGNRACTRMHSVEVGYSQRSLTADIPEAAPAHRCTLAAACVRASAC